MAWVEPVSGGVGLDDHGLALSDHDPLAGDCLQLAGEAARPAFVVDTGLVVVAAQVDEACGGVRQQVIDDHQDGVAGGNDGLLLAAAFGDAPVARSQEAVGASGGGDDVAQRAGQPRVALAAPLGLCLPADSWTWGQNLAHDTRCAADGKRAISTPISAISS